MHQQGHEGHGGMSREMVRHHYLLLAVNLFVGLGIMYFVMFAMIASWGEFIQNINFFYMALMMWASMGVATWTRSWTGLTPSWQLMRRPKSLSRRPGLVESSCPVCRLTCSAPCRSSERSAASGE